MRSMRQLISARLSPADPWPTGHGERAAIQGLTLETVVPRGGKVLADYRYIFLLNPAAQKDHDVRQLAAAQSVWHAVPATHRNGMAFALDGVVDEQGQIWFLEANCNPQLHPGFYVDVLTQLFDLGTTQE